MATLSFQSIFSTMMKCMNSGQCVLVSLFITKCNDPDRREPTYSQYKKVTFWAILPHGVDKMAQPIGVKWPIHDKT